MKKTLITFHFYYPVQDIHSETSIIYYGNEYQCRQEAILFAKTLSDCFTHITSKVL